MKALFIAYSQAYNQDIIELLDSFGQRGFTRWTEVGGRGGSDGIPHMGDHAWPEMNHAMFSFVKDDDTAAKIISALRETDGRYPDLGLRVFSWTIDD